MIGVLLVLVIIGVILYFVNTYIPMAPPIRTLINIVAVIFVILWLLTVFGVADIPVPRVR